MYSKVVCITDEVRGVLGSHVKLQPSKMVVINNGVCLKTIAAAHPVKKSELFAPFNDTDIILLQVAGFREQKDQPTLIRALQYLPSHVKAVFAGDGVLRQKNEKLAAELGLSNRVLFLGVRSDVPQLLKTADIMVLSSHYEGLSLSSIEGLACGKPFVASDVAGLSHIVSGAGILFPCGDDRALANEVEKLMLDQEHYQQVASQCVKRAEQYDIDLMVNNLHGLYREILKN